VISPPKWTDEKHTENSPYKDAWRISGLESPDHLETSASEIPTAAMQIKQKN
jgi:hypothetical protein